MAVDVIALMDALKIETGDPRRVRLGRADGQHRRGALARALQGHGFGERLSDRQPGSGQGAVAAAAELQWWYQFYFATERGRAGYEKYRRDFARLIWQLASPKWNFDDATFDRSAAAFDNPDHVAIVIHNYRWRLGLAEGEREIRRAGEAARRRSRDRGADDHPRRRRQRRAASGRRAPTPRNSPADMSTGRSRAASGTTFRRRRRRPSPRPSSTPKASDRSLPAQASSTQGAAHAR